MINDRYLHRGPRQRGTRTALTLFSLLATPFALPAAEPNTPDATPGSDEVVKMEDYVVTGYRRSLELSLDTKRNANAIVDVITAEDIGKFPDTNVAESLSHIPGVTVDRLFGQGERVSILGTDPNLNRTLLNGQTVASGDWFILDAPSRQFNYTLLAPEVIGQAEVFKSSEARLPEGSIGGTILLHTRSPLDIKPFTFSGSAGDMYNDRGKDHDFFASNVASWRNEEGTFGALLGLQWSRENIRRDGVEALGTVAAGTVDPTYTANPNALLPNAVNAALFEQLRERKGGNLVLAMRPSDQFELELNILNVEVANDNFNQSYYAFPGWWQGGKLSNVTVVDGIVDSATVDNNIGVMDLFYRKATIKTEAYDAKATIKAGAFTVTGQAGYTKASGGTQGQYYMEPLLASANSGVGSTSYTITGGATHPRFSWAESGVNTNPAAWSVGGPWWNGNIAADPEEDDESYGQVDVAFEPADGLFTKFLGGMRYTDHSTSQNWYNITLNSLPFSTLADFGPGVTPGNYLSGLPGVTNDMAVHSTIDPDQLHDNVFGALFRDANGNLTNMTLQDALNAHEGFQPTQSFQVDEKTYAGYVQGNFRQGNLSGNVGLRYVRTETASSGYAVSGATTTPITMKKDYDNVLPSINFAYPVSDDVVLRAAAAAVIARPNYADLSSSVSLYDSIGTGVGGNPNLDPYKSTNLDFSAEWYFTKTSAFAVNLFYKDISNYILKSNGAEDYFNEARGIVTTYQISRPENAGSATSKGISLFVQHAWDNGFGINANYTYVDASGDGGSDLPYSSKNQINISPFYEHGRWLFRVTYGFRSAYFTNVDRGNNVYTDDYTQLDANMSVQLTDKLSLTVAATNLLDETYYVYTQVPARMFQGEYKNGRRVQAGLHWQF